MTSIEIQYYRTFFSYRPFNCPTSIFPHLHLSIMVTFVTSQIMGTALEITDRYSDVKVRGFGAAGVI
jgi:hypothetical protein